ncbi:MAG: helix-turn-helix domain-containing protein, partial [Clostridia bacterium]|nr:helix-turn-helix domain-containing protein [Clostridia bacterium]
MKEKTEQLHIGAHIARLRQKQGMTQTDLAKQLYVSNKTVSKWERGIGYPEITQLAGLARVLGTTVDSLIMGDRAGIAVVGNVLTDTVKQVDSYPEKGMLSNIRSLSTAVGGCVPNTAIDLAKIDRNLRVSALGKVGQDEGGRYVVGEMQRHGIDVSGIVSSQKAST